MGVTVQWKTLGFDALLTGLRQDRWDLVIASHGITERTRQGRDLHRAALLLGRHDHRHGPGHQERQGPGGQGGGSADRHQLPGKRQRSLRHQGDEELPHRRGRPQRPGFAPRGCLGHRPLRRQGRGREEPGAGFKLGDMLFIERIAAAVAKGNQSLAQGWSKALAETMADGSYAQLSKYFNEDVRCQ